MSLSAKPRTRAPAHQNTFAFKHNKNSKKTAKILKITHVGLCAKCEEKIEWRKKFRKYKPIKQVKKCRECDQLKISKAYHILCNDCAGSKRVCPICKTPADSQGDATGDAIQGHRATNAEIEFYLSTLRERERRTIQRKLDQKSIVILKNADGELYQKEVEKEVSEGADSDSHAAMDEDDEDLEDDEEAESD